MNYQVKSFLLDKSESTWSLFQLFYNYRERTKCFVEHSALFEGLLMMKRKKCCDCPRPEWLAVYCFLSSALQCFLFSSCPPPSVVSSCRRPQSFCTLERSVVTTHAPTLPICSSATPYSAHSHSLYSPHVTGAAGRLRAFVMNGEGEGRGWGKEEEPGSANRRWAGMDAGTTTGRDWCRLVRRWELRQVCPVQGTEWTRVIRVYFTPHRTPRFGRKPL